MGKLERKCLALIDVFLPVEAGTGLTLTVNEDIANYQHHGMLMIERQPELRGRQIVDIACLRRAAHVVPTDILPNRY